MTTGTEKLAEGVREMVAELRQARDEIRLQLHLAGMETRDTFRDVESKLTVFEARAHEIGDDPATELKEAFTHLQTAFRKIRDKLAG